MPGPEPPSREEVVAWILALPTEELVAFVRKIAALVEVPPDEVLVIDQHMRAPAMSLGGVGPGYRPAPAPEPPPRVRCTVELVDAGPFPKRVAYLVHRFLDVSVDEAQRVVDGGPAVLTGLHPLGELPDILRRFRQIGAVVHDRTREPCT